MKTLINNNRYLDDALVGECFDVGVTHHVDKTMTGNGFTSAMLRINPLKDHTNILIMPNKAGVMGKERAYKDSLKDMKRHQDEFGGNRLKFFYAESTDAGFHDADVLVFVVDSYLLLIKEHRISFDAIKVDKFVIDEYHTAEKDGGYRIALRDLLFEVEESLKDHTGACLTTVTATPNLTSPITIEIENKLLKPTVIQLASDENRVIKEIKELYAQGEEIVVLSNSSEHLYGITYNRDKSKVIPINYTAGTNFMTSAVKKVTIKQDSKSRMSFVTSRGFESMDIDYRDANVYFFEDFSNENTTLSLPNLIQGINRPRAGAKKITYVRLLSSKDAPSSPPKDLERFVNRDDWSTESKKKKEHKAYHKYVIFKENENDFGATIKVDEVAVRMRAELIDWSLGNENLLQPEGKLKAYLKKRKITFIKPDKKEAQKRFISRVKSDTKKVYLKSNEFVIRRDSLFDNSFDNKVGYMIRDILTEDSYEKQMIAVSKWFQEYMMCKNYDGSYEATSRESKAFRLLTNRAEFERFMKELVRVYSKMSIDKYGESESYDSIKDFKKNIVSISVKLIVGFMKNKVKFYSNKVGHRDYNTSAVVNMAVVNYVGDYLGAYVTEADVATCNPRILFALVGLELPENFYGENKERKTQINKLLNTLTFRSNDAKVQIFFKEDDVARYKSHRRNKIKELKRLGFPDAVIWWLEDNVFNAGYVGYFSYLMSFHEKNIISDIREVLTSQDNNGCPRRHDSVLIVNNRADLDFLNRYEYKGQGGFFNICNSKESFNLIDREIGIETNRMDSKYLDAGIELPVFESILPQIEQKTAVNVQYDLF